MRKSVFAYVQFLDENTYNNERLLNNDKQTKAYNKLKHFSVSAGSSSLAVWLLLDQTLKAQNNTLNIYSAHFRCFSSLEVRQMGIVLTVKTHYFIIIIIGIMLASYIYAWQSFGFQTRYYWHLFLSVIFY